MRVDFFEEERKWSEMTKNKKLKHVMSKYVVAGLSVAIIVILFLAVIAGFVVVAIGGIKEKAEIADAGISIILIAGTLLAVIIISIGIDQRLHRYDSLLKPSEREYLKYLLHWLREFFFGELKF